MGFVFVFRHRDFLLLLRGKWKALALLVIPCILIMYVPALASNARFRIPIEPILCLIAAWTFGEMLPLLKHRLLKRAPPAH